MIKRLLVVLAAFAVSGTASGCNSWEKKLEAQRLALRDSANACPAPATCSEKRHGDGGHDFKVCSGGPQAAPYAPGDVVIIHEIGLDMIAGIKEKKADDSYIVRFADDMPITRSHKSIVARVCK
jgi:hypothetical protein